MKGLLKAYFGHWPIPVYYGVILVLLVYTAGTGVLERYFYLLAIPPLAQPFFEWGYHQFVLHAKAPKTSGVYQRIMKDIHYDHHQDTKNVKLLFAPFYLSFASFAIGFVLVALVAWSLKVSIVVSIAGLGCYLFYEWMHLVCHWEFTPRMAYAKRMRKLHYYHHFFNDRYWWGVTSHLADRVLGTYPDPKTVTRRLTMKAI